MGVFHLSAVSSDLCRSTDVISVVNVFLTVDNVFPFVSSKHLLKHSNQTTSVVFGIHLDTSET